MSSKPPFIIGSNDESVEAIFPETDTQQVSQRGYPTVRELLVDEIDSQKGKGTVAWFVVAGKVGGVLTCVRPATTHWSLVCCRGPAWCATVRVPRRLCGGLSYRRPGVSANVVMTTADHFHVIENLHQALNTVRRTLQRHADEATRQHLKGSRWLLLKNPTKGMRTSFWVGWGLFVLIIDSVPIYFFKYLSQYSAK
jgi:hypothetical protein